MRARDGLPVVGAKPVEGHIELDDVGAKEHKVPNLCGQGERHLSLLVSTSCLPSRHPPGD